METKRALLLIDFINEIVHPDGKLSGKGYSDYIERHNTESILSELIIKFRSNKELIIHVGVGFSPNYLNQPLNSPLFGAAKKFGALNSTGWGCEFIDFASPNELDGIIQKTRVSAFFGTSLDSILRNNGIQEIVIAGCATDLAVQSAARDAHDRDYQVVIAEDACVAATDIDHESSLSVLKKIATIKTVNMV